MVCTAAVMMEIWGSFEMSVNFHQALVCRYIIEGNGMIVMESVSERLVIRLLVVCTSERNKENNLTKAVSSSEI